MQFSNLAVGFCALALAVAPARATVFTGSTGGGQPHSNYQPTLSMNYIVLLNGQYPDSDPNNNAGHFLGDVVLFAGDFAPHGWSFANGQTLAVNTNLALF